MKKTIFLAVVLIGLIVYGYTVSEKQSIVKETGMQEGVLIFTDTTDVISIPAGATNVTLTIADSTLTGTDSCKLFSRSGTRPFLSLIAAHEASQVTTTTNISLLIPGAGVTSSYILPDNIGSVTQDYFLVRLNESTDDAYLPKTRWVMKYNF